MSFVEKYTYRVTWSEEDKECVGLCTEFPSLSWLAKTPEAALKGIRKQVEEVIRDLNQNNEPVPEPLSTRQFSGKLLVRIPPHVHRKLAMEAEEEKVSLNRLISSKLVREA